MNAHVRADMVNRVFDGAYVNAVFRELDDAYVRTAALDQATHDLAERKAIYAWMSGLSVRRAAERVADKIGAGR